MAFSGNEHQLRAVAEQLLEDVHAMQQEEEYSSYRLAFDRLLLTVHQRVRAKAATREQS